MIKRIQTSRAALVRFKKTKKMADLPPELSDGKAGIFRKKTILLWCESSGQMELNKRQDQQQPG